MVDDHQAPPPTVDAANKVREVRRIVKKYGIKNFFEYGRGGILHQVFAENGMYAPGELIAQCKSGRSARASVWRIVVQSAGVSASRVERHLARLVCRQRRHLKGGC